ncbi:hypothetical protein [Acinetobacter baumannii]|uniref:hypothetical protein n=1 Tax=Acinetobacter baumannii TaxID=470 RepID=UPI00298CAD8E|nr:hypothetical protein [Acinetobacter baumannii]WNX64877.1 hypothetical protein RWV42_07355 [Acinetobacter baumannii]HCA5150969.1 hypothetical protein [Acinetobacter baumannii]
MLKIVNLLVKDQHDIEYEAIGIVANLENQDIALFNKVQQIEIAGYVLLPNIDLVFESPEEGKIYKVVKIIL